MVDAEGALAFTVPLVAPPRAAGLPRDGGVAVTGRALERDAAVGLLSLSAEELLKDAFFTGVGVVGVFRIRASDAAVGAKRPVEGVFGRLEVGVFERAGLATARLAREGVLGREGVEGVLLGPTVFLAADAIDDVD